MIRVLSVLLLLFTYAQHASAYLDPGTGSMVLQGIIAALAVIGFTIKSYWYKIRGFFGKGGSSSLLEEEDEDAQRTE
ncbi:MAG: hypothetical protein HRT77_02405 [Halioglobus sp.]|nr:hypothetical protein [Halioglobus sp.]